MYPDVLGAKSKNRRAQAHFKNKKRTFKQTHMKCGKVGKWENGSINIIT